MMESLIDRIEKQLAVVGLSASKASHLAGLSDSFIRDMRRKGTQPSFENLKKLANVLKTTPDHLLGETVVEPLIGLRVEGISQAGNFLDITLVEDKEDDREIIAAPRDKRFPHAHQYALKVAGDSMNRLFPEGSYAICAAWGDTGLNLNPGQILHVERHIAAHVIETTIKRFAVRDGKMWLDPDSSNPKHAPILVNGEEDTAVSVKGIVLSKWEPLEL